MKRLLLLFGFMFMLTPAFAQENVLQTIEITPVKDTYNIVLVADKAVDVKKVVNEPNKITLNLKDIRASKNLNTVYNNVSGVDTVMVEPQGKGISIFFQAENAEAATVSFDTLTTPVINPVQSKKNLKLSNPIESYAPIYREEVQPERTNALLNMIKSRQAMPKDSLDEETSTSDTANKFISFGVIILAIVGAMKLFRRKESSVKIGLQQPLSAKNDMYRGLSGLSPISQMSMTPEKPFTTVNYGLNAYQKEDRNPYETSPMQFHNPRFAAYNNNVSMPQMQQMPQSPLPQMNVRPQAVQYNQQQTATITKPTTDVAVNQGNPNVDNLRFLESMTEIYEKSGRHDLARGLKASLSKTGAK